MLRVYDNNFEYRLERRATNYRSYVVDRLKERFGSLAGLAEEEAHGTKRGRGWVVRFGQRRRDFYVYETGDAAYDLADEDEV